MSALVELDGLDLAAMISSRICHDVISPVGAIVNGLEVLEEEKDPEMREIALDLVRKSATAASARLQFARLAFGAAGSAGAQMDTGDAESVTRGILADAKTELIWNGPRLLLPKNKVKLLLNLIVIAVSTVPRGGTVSVTIEGDEPDTRFRIVTAGSMVRIAPALPGLLAGTPENDHVDAHVIQPFFTGVVARQTNMAASIEAHEDTAVITAVPAT